MVSATTTTETTGGTYGYATSGNARFYVQTSSNTASGANQLAVAVNTIGRTNLVLGYSVEIISAQPRTVGVLCQYRVGSSGAWTNVAASSGLNPYSQAGGTAGIKTTVQATIPPAAENQPAVQVRWATWRGSETGSSSGVAIDSVMVSGTAVSSSLTVSPVPSSFSESAGANASLVTVSAAAPAPADLAVTLVSSNTGEAIVEGPNSWTESGVNQIVPVSQIGVPSGFERMTFEVDDSASPARFLRLRFLLN